MLHLGGRGSATGKWIGINRGGGDARWFHLSFCFGASSLMQDKDKMVMAGKTP